jgi:hypothetical protein
MSGTENMRQIDLTNSTNAALAQSADRIATLLRSPVAKNNPDLSGSLDDFLGAVYALIFAREGNFTHRSDRPIDITAVEKRAKQVAVGQVRTDGKWMAGFHFNSALFRLSAAYHRILKIVTNKKGDVGILRPAAENVYRHVKGSDWCSDNIRAVHGQVTDLKHTPKGTFSARREKAGLPNAVSAVSELLDLIETWASKA